MEEKLYDILRHVTIFSGMSDTELGKISSFCDIIDMKAGEILIRQGAEATNIYIIFSGKVRVVLNLDKNPINLIELTLGHCIGEASIIGIQKHSASAIIVEDTKLLVLSRKVLFEVYDRDKEQFSLLILNIARELARRLYNTDRTLLNKD